MKFSEHSNFLEKRQLQKFLENSSCLQWFFFDICVTIIEKFRNVFFPVILLKSHFLNFSQDSWRLTQIENFLSESTVDSSFFFKFYFWNIFPKMLFSHVNWKWN